MGFYYGQQPHAQGFYYDQQQQEQQQKGFYYNQQQQQTGFYYEQEDGFYYDGFYYSVEDDGFYYDRPDGFYYNNPNGFYYGQEQEKGFYYEQFVPKEGFYYENDQEDNENPEFSNYWKKGPGRDRVLKALVGVRTLVDQHVLENPHDPSPDGKRAIRDACTIQVVRDVLKTFMIHVNPVDFMKHGGDAEKLSVLIGKECQAALSPDRDFRKKWHEPGSNAESSLNEVTKDIIPFIIKWMGNEDFHNPNFSQLDALAALTAKRMALEEMHKYAAATPLPKFGKNFVVNVFTITKALIDGIFKRINPPKPAAKGHNNPPAAGAKKPAPKKKAAKSKKSKGKK